MSKCQKYHRFRMLMFIVIIFSVISSLSKLGIAANDYFASTSDIERLFKVEESFAGKLTNFFLFFGQFLKYYEYLIIFWLKLYLFIELLLKQRKTNDEHISQIESALSDVKAAAEKKKMKTP